MSGGLNDKWVTVGVMSKCKFEYNTIKICCLCVEKFIFYFIIDVKYSVHFTIKHSVKYGAGKLLEYKNNI